MEEGVCEEFGGFPGSGAKAPHSKCRGPSFDPWSGN